MRVLAAQELLAPLLARALFLIGLNAKIGLNGKLTVLSDLVSGYGEIFFSAGVFFIGIDILRGVKMWESEGFVNVRTISRFCECDLL